MRAETVTSTVVGFLLVVLVTAASGCGSTSGKAEQEATAVQNVFASSRGGNPWHMFLSRPGSIACHLTAGGVSPTTVPASCTTRAALHADGSAVVTLEITFKWEGSTDHHYWAYWLSQTGRITRTRNYGDKLYPIYAV